MEEKRVIMTLDEALRKFAPDEEYKQARESFSQLTYLLRHTEFEARLVLFQYMINKSFPDRNERLNVCINNIANTAHTKKELKAVIEGIMITWQKSRNEEG